MNGEDFGVLIPIVALCIPIVRMWTNHKLKLAQIQAGILPVEVNEYSSSVEPNLAREVSELRREVSALRETSTRFDMSFDAALSRLEQRMDGYESRAPEVAEVEPLRYGFSTTEAQEPLVVGSKV